MQIPRRSIPPIPGLIAFEATARYLSFSRAAEALALSQGAVSKRVRQLEEQLGLALILRGPQHLELTRAGAAYLPKVRDLLMRIDRATRDLLAETGQPQELIVRCDEAFAIGWLVPRLGEFTRRCPEAVVHLQTAPGPRNGSQDGSQEGQLPADVRIRLAPDGVAAGDETRLFGCELGAVIGRQSAAGSSDAELLGRLPLLCAPGQAAPLQGWPQSWPQSLPGAPDRAGAPPSGPFPGPISGPVSGPASGPALGPAPGLVCDQPSVLIAAAANGHGIAVLPRLLVQEDLRIGRLRQIGGWMSGPGAWMISAPGAQGNPAAAGRFRSWIEAASQTGRTLQPVVS